MTILIADPCPTTRRALCRLLREHQLATVHSYAGLRQVVSEVQPDVLLVDLHLPDVCALDVLPELLRIAPVVLMSGCAETWQIDWAFRRGVAAFLDKAELPQVVDLLASLGRAPRLAG